MNIFNHSGTFILGATLLVSMPALGSTGLKPASHYDRQDTLAYDMKLPFDDGVLHGKLANGFEYYIRRNVEPKDRVVMYLATKVGSILETDEEQGLAHFMEHMNFNGTKNFPKNELVSYLQSVGVRFGSDLNAFTGFDQTVYQLPIPSDDPELVKTGLQVLRDWAQDALLEEEEIDKERGVVIEELVGSKGAQQRMRDQYFPTLLNHSLYADRLPIGKREIIEKFDYQTLRDFHQKWYRPDLQALIVVGDINVANIENQIKEMFGDLSTPENKPERKEYDIPLLGRNQFIAVTDPEMTATVVQIYTKHPEKEVKTVGDFKYSLTRSLFNQLASARFSELTRQSNPPFIQGGASIGGFLNGLDVLTLFVLAKPGEIEGGVTAVVTEIERIKQHGFSEAELARGVSSFEARLETRYNERDKRTSESYVNSYMSHFLEEEASLSDEDSYLISKQLLSKITLEEVNALAESYYTGENRDVIIQAPEKDKESLPTEEDVNSWFAAIAATEIAPYEDDTASEPILAQAPVAGTIVSRAENEALGTVELMLSNGVKVVLKPTDFKNDEISIRGVSTGGTSQYGDEDYLSASFATSLINSSGLGAYNATQFNKFKTGKNLAVTPFIGEQTQGFSARSGKKDLNTAFELIYLYYTAPRTDQEAFEGLIARNKAALANRVNDPNAAFSDTINQTLYGDNIRRNSLTVEKLGLIDPVRAFEIYQDRFADASGLVVTIVGSFTEEEISPLLTQYLASLPALDRNEQMVDLGLYPAEVGTSKKVYKDKEQKANVRLVYYGEYAYSQEENLLLDALESVLSIKLIERLREDESGVYGVSARSSYSKFPRERYTFGVYFGTSPDKVEPLRASALNEIEKVKSVGPLQEDIDKFVIEQKRQLEVRLKENGFWLGHLSGSYEENEDPSYILAYLDDLGKVTVEKVKEVANKYLKDERRYEFMLLPEQP